MAFDQNKSYEKDDIASWPPGHRRCRECHEVLPFENFHKHKTCLFGVNTVCKVCRLPKSKQNYDNQTIEYKMWYAARQRALEKNLPFTIAVSDIVIPEVCPVLGVSLEYNTQHSPSLDQVIPKAGYTPDNIRVISKRANRLKNDATVEELTAVIKYMQS